MLAAFKTFTPKKTPPSSRVCSKFPARVFVDPPLNPASVLPVNPVSVLPVNLTAKLIWLRENRSCFDIM